MAFQSLQLRGITKCFKGVPANQDLDFDLAPGEIVGLLGENGAGKTTLMNILYGLYRPDSGRILLNGQELRLDSPRDAIAKGIGMVHQHFMLVQKHSVAENIVLGMAGAPALFPARKIRRRLEEFGERLGLQVDPEAAVWQLSAGEQQRVEIVKALFYGAEILILDEPTSVLTPIEARELFSVVRRMAGEGKAIVLISHKLEEIMGLCTRICVLRKGRNAGGADPRQATREDVVRMMVGRSLSRPAPRSHTPAGEIVLELSQLQVKSDRGLDAVHGVSFSVRRGEVLGVAGVSGNGQRELVEAITGLRRSQAGSILFLGREIRGESARVISSLGLAHVPEERIKFGIVPNLMVYENSVLKSHRARRFSDVMFLDYANIKDHAESLVSGFEIQTPSIEAPARNLSGGNVQKLILGREISNSPQLLVASHPTYGLDLAATDYIRGQIIKRRDEGSAVLLVSEDLDELFTVCDRIAVMFRGRLMGIGRSQDLSVEDVGLMMAGSKQLAREDWA